MRRPVTPVIASLVLLALIALAHAPTAPVAAQADQRCFPETGFCIAGQIRTYWERNGGLPVFGFPITAQAQEMVEGRSLQVQWFERDRLEIQADGSVTAGRLGVERLEQMGTPWQFGPGSPAGQGCLAFAETGHQICGAFAQAWQQNGGAGRFGYPITGEFQTTIDGKALTVQYFERRRFELHEGGQILLGLLGREVFTGRGGPTLAPPPAPPVPAPAPTTAPPAPAPTPAPDPRAGCHSSYPDVCIPPPPPDLDCGDIPHRRFRVVGSDPHRFDRDNDGIGCES